QREERSRQESFFRTCDKPGKLVRFSRKVRFCMADADDAKKDEIADALSRVEHDVPSEHAPSASIPPPPMAPQMPKVPPPPTPSAAEFRRPSRPAAPGAPSAAPPTPATSRPARPDRPDRPDRPTGPPTTTWSEDEAAEVRAHDQGQPGDVIIDD